MAFVVTSFVQLLDALHYPPDGIDATLDFFAAELRKTSLSVSGLERQLFVLPAALDLADIQDMPVTPEHLARNPANPWQLADHLRALGRRLAVDAVFIDLRAGLSELASPILFDPRVDHFFISTVAPQSVQGLAEVLRRLHAFNRQLPPERRDAARPTVVLSLLTKELRDTGHYGQALQTLNAAYPGEDLADDGALRQGLQWLEADFRNELMSIDSVREALELLPQSGLLFDAASEWADALYAPAAAASGVQAGNSTTSGPSARQERAEKLRLVCESAQFADSGATAPILVTEPLLNLGKHCASELPSLLMVGAKGAGKTFIYRQLIRTGAWQPFLEKLGFPAADTVDADIFPALWSRNIKDTPDGEIKQAQGRVLDRMAGDRQRLLRASDVVRQIEEASAVHQTPPGFWENFWDKLLLRQFGVDGGGLSALNRMLTARSRRVVFVFDGVEDAFGDATDGTAANAIRALLGLTDRISELADRHIGALVFVRADYVQAVVRQNLGQLLQRFLPFRLQWDAESFLRLAFMLACQAGIIEGELKSAESLGIDALKGRLESLWGKKLGSEKSKEAHSARWTYAALCDLKGNVQARDLVRFLRIAAELETARTGTAWPDRILSPESMRKAIAQCSKEKVDEARQEIAPLKTWMEALEKADVRNLKAPFSQAQAQLSPGLLKALQEIGVIYEDSDGDLGEERLFLPEIYRFGLGFATSTGGRPRTQALLKKNMRNIPL